MSSQMEPLAIPLSWLALLNVRVLYQYHHLFSHEPYLAATGDSSPNTSVHCPESPLFGLNHVQSWCILRITRKAMAWRTLLLQLLDLRRSHPKLPWSWSWIPCLGLRIQLPDRLPSVRGCEENYGTAITYFDLGTG
jgi:hypothetical protein